MRTKLDDYIWAIEFKQAFGQVAGSIPLVIEGTDPIIDTLVVHNKGYNDVIYYYYDNDEFPEHYWEIYKSYIEEHYTDMFFMATHSDFISFQMELDTTSDLWVLMLEYTGPVKSF